MKTEVSPLASVRYGLCQRFEVKSPIGSVSDFLLVNLFFPEAVEELHVFVATEVGGQVRPHGGGRTKADSEHLIFMHSYLKKYKSRMGGRDSPAC